MAITLGAIQLEASRIREAFANTPYATGVDLRSLNVSGSDNDAEAALEILKATANALEHMRDVLKHTAKHHRDTDDRLRGLMEAVRGAARLQQLIEEAKR